MTVNFRHKPGQRKELVEILMPAWLVQEFFEAEKQCTGMRARGVSDTIKSSGFFAAMNSIAKYNSDLSAIGPGDWYYVDGKHAIKAKGGKENSQYWQETRNGFRYVWSYDRESNRWNGSIHKEDALIELLKKAPRHPEHESLWQIIGDPLGHW